MAEVNLHLVRHTKDIPRKSNGTRTGYEDGIIEDYLARLLSATLSASPADLRKDGSLLSDTSLPDTLRKCERFLQGNQTSLFAHKYNLVKVDELIANASFDSDASVVFRLSSHPPTSIAIIASVAILKRPQPLDLKIPLGDQLQVVNLPGLDAPQLSNSSTSPFDLLHSIVHSALSPYFDVLSRNQIATSSAHNSVDGDRRLGIPGVKKKLAELELSLLQLQQNVEIPQLSLPLHPAIQTAIDMAKEAGTIPSVDDIPKSVLADTLFHNNLRALVKRWIESVHAITLSTRDPTRGTAMQEINFHLDKELALDEVKAQLEGDGILLTLRVLKETNQFKTIVSFDQETKLSDTTLFIRGVNLLMRDFPLPDLLASLSLETLEEALEAIFAHVNNRWHKPCAYPTRRMMYLFEAISSDLEQRVCYLLNGRQLMLMSIQDFEDYVRRAEQIWESWDDHIRKLTYLARDRGRESKDNTTFRVASRHVKLRERLTYVANFRRSHEQLQQTIRTVFDRKSSNALRQERMEATDRASFDEAGVVDPYDEVAHAYVVYEDIDVLDISVEGTRLWERAESLYNDRTSRVENSIIARLRDRLATAKTANEMFRVFAKFNALFIRHRIRSAISEYQNQLMENVKRDITILHERYRQQYGYSQAHAMAQLHDVPPVSGAIIWSHQVKRQLDGYVKKIEDVLGSQWRSHAEGERLSDEIAKFQEKLNMSKLYASWTAEILDQDYAISGYLFDVGQSRATGNLLQINVNFDARVISLFKEVRNLVNLDYHIPYELEKRATEARYVYPFAISLVESMRMFLQVNSFIIDAPDVLYLVDQYRREVLSSIATGIGLKWRSLVYEHEIRSAEAAGMQRISTVSEGESEHAQFVKSLARDVSVLKSKTTDLVSARDTILQSLTNLQTCHYAAGSFGKELHIIQESIDHLELEGFSNLRYFVVQTNSSIEQFLRERLIQALLTWTDAFSTAFSDDDLPLVSLRRENSSLHESNVPFESPAIETSAHELCIRNQTISLEPPLGFARSTWLMQLHEWIGQICGLSKVHCSHYGMDLSRKENHTLPNRYAELLVDCAEQIASLYLLIDQKIEEARAYVDTWLQFQSLWDLQHDQVEDALGEDLEKWLQTLAEMRKIRTTFDNSTATKSFGKMKIEYEHVQTKINAKYDQWQDEMHTRFAAKLGTRMSHLLMELRKSTSDLQDFSVDLSSTAAVVTFITTVRRARRDVDVWAPEVEIFGQGQAALNRHRFHFSQDWVFVDKVEHDWEILKEVLLRKEQIISVQIETLRAKIMAEDRIACQRIDEITAQWNEEKPISGSTPHAHARQTLTNFETKVIALNKHVELLDQAKDALQLPMALKPGLKAILEEIRDFIAVWVALSTVWQGINELREMPWNSVQPRKVKLTLTNLANMIKEMPSSMRQYTAFDDVQTAIRRLLKAQTMLLELKSDAVRERHWILVFKTLKPGQRFSQSYTTLGDIWDLQLVESEKAIRDIVSRAQGELALEEFLKQTKQTWQEYTLELVNYQNKCRLIRGWDELFAKCGDNLNSLQAMRHSPYYKEFEDEASFWDEKLNRASALFNIWIDVQRQWVYLEGVFNGNADIMHLLPIESSRFQNINSEFLAIMKKVQRTPLVLDVLSIPGIQISLERLLELLKKIQKALGEYLEKERSSFPRFYFVGDEDLLEIIGNSKDVLRVARHLGKMFAGISGLVLDESGNIVGFESSQGEKVDLSKTISLAHTPRANEWLAEVERHMRNTLAELLSRAVVSFRSVLQSTGVDQLAFTAYLNDFPLQITVLAGQIWYNDSITTALEEGQTLLPQVLEQHERILQHLATLVTEDIDVVFRKKCEQVITEFVFQRSAIEQLILHGVESVNHHLWLLQLRHVYIPNGDFSNRLTVKMASASIPYGFEYLGMAERLVRTPLTERCFLTMTQALEQRLGGSPYGPAGTGKTETVKALGLQLGRFTLVFNCDDTFDFQAMGRIFLGICQVGAWGCFDEFNRLEERILSAVSQQIQNIQLGLKRMISGQRSEIELVGRRFPVNSSTGLFITMNLGYAGRSNLPDNLKKLFRSVAMSKPDKELIAEVTLFSQGFAQAREISKQTVSFFDTCSTKMSRQNHYDFGLRALKSVLNRCGALKRFHKTTHGSADGYSDLSEPEIVLQSLHETIGPKLIVNDITHLDVVEAESFPDVSYISASLGSIQKAVTDVAMSKNLVVSTGWMTKVLQLYQIQHLHHGVMLVGCSGSGKSSTWKTLLAALQGAEGIEGVHYIIDPKVISKEILYGSLDSTTREWTDGLFTSILRKIIDNFRGEASKRHWIVFDGDVDPEWVENLNSVLDDNRILTLPNGERLVLPNSVRIIFEVNTLKHATLATVSRCGMVWFHDDNVTPEMMFSNFVGRLKENLFEDIDTDAASTGLISQNSIFIQTHFATILETHLGETRILLESLERAQTLQHIMTFTYIRALNTLFALLSKACRTLVEHSIQNTDFVLEPSDMTSFIIKKAILAIVWSFAGDCPLADRQRFGNSFSSLTIVDLPLLSDETCLIDFEVSLPSGAWIPWLTQVPTIEVSTHSIIQTDVVIPTLDTVRHESLLYSFLAEHKPLILCGPPGSGKTMTLFSALRKLPNMDVVGLNFSSATTPDLLIKTFEQHCEYRRTLSGTVMCPAQIGRWLVIFCDEINLPARDKYGSQRVISFLRQMIEHGGFWRASDKTWITIDRIQFVGACNPPTDAGRVPLGSRFLNHAPVIMVDYPGHTSLMQIYKTFTNAVLKVTPSLRGYSTSLTEAMIKLYETSRARFTPDIQPHYIYSPRELTRWVRGIYEAIKPLEDLDLDGLVRIWTHEALRLFQDRLIGEEERVWTTEAIQHVALTHFPNINRQKCLGGPILFSNWLSQNYVPVSQDQLREFVKARLRTFCEEEVDIPLVLYDDALDHILRIDRVFRQPQGHVILIGISGSGKTTLARFVAWMNGLKVFQIKVHGKYSAEDFDEDLRAVLRRCGCKGEKMCFIMDESNVLDSAFLERMNTLLANAEIPGLFEGDEFASLITGCREGAQRHGLMLDSPEELYSWFTQQIVKNLHVVFTMNPPEEGLATRAATSPALFNRCVLNWFGDWSEHSLFQVGKELSQSLDLDRGTYLAPPEIPLIVSGLALPLLHRDVVINTMVFIHTSMHSYNHRLEKQQGRINFLTPRHFLDFVHQFASLYKEKQEDLENQQRHLNIGLDKLKETVEKVRDMRRGLTGKKLQLDEKILEANEKLQKMLQDQQKAEKTRKIAIDIESALQKQDEEITRQKEIAKADLAKAEPAVLEAQRSVNNIKRQQLTEVRSMGSPPASVKLALEAVCVLLGHKVDNWKAIQAIVRRDDFIATILAYDNEERMTASHRAKMHRDYFSLEDFTYERVNRASKACGPLVQWVEAQVNYSEILHRIGPLREEVRLLEDSKLDTEAQGIAIRQKIQEFDLSISDYKKDYATLISESENLKAEIARVEQKVQRSLHLLDSLGSERKRWDDGSKLFDTEIDTIIGDTLIAAAFLTYGGLYDQQYRSGMLGDWYHQLSLSGIKHRPQYSMIDYLSNPDERLEWQERSLPVDDLCTENAIMLKRFNRYPLIIDPTGRVLELLHQQYAERRVVITSFLDANFVKQLETALRFGGTILLQDAEYMDPVLNYVLNREYQKTGGRVLVQLGKQEIDFSPNFKLFLITRDPSATFAPDICSRTTFVNFTVTQSSLRSQSLNEVLKSERPDVNERRSNLIKIQGEFAVHLRRLERRLLQALNESQGNILDDETLVNTLETVKEEVSLITSKVTEADGVMAEVELISSEYLVVAQSCSAIFAVLEQLNNINHFYQFSLEFFSDIFQSVLQSAKAKRSNSSDTKTRVYDVVKELFVTTFRRTSIALLNTDRIALAMLLSQATPYKLERALFGSLTNGKDDDYRDVSSLDISTQQTLLAEAVARLDLEAIVPHTEQSAWTSFLSENLTEFQSQHILPSTSPACDQVLVSLVLSKALRPDRLIPTAQTFVNTLFGVNLLDEVGELEELIDQITGTTPIAMCCSPGFDASFKIDNIVIKRGVKCRSVAMGSNESRQGADRAITQGAASGTWVLIKNVHLAVSWLQNLEKRLESLKVQPGFRLILCMEVSLKIPTKLLRMSRIVMCEQPSGIRANMKDTMSPTTERALRTPVERSRLYLLLSLTHAVIQERLRYAPTLGWSKIWEFNDSDYDCAAHVIDTWLDLSAHGRSNIAPSNIPWDMLRALITITYAGKIDAELDQQRLSSLVNSIFGPETFDEAFNVVDAVQIPDDRKSKKKNIATDATSVVAVTQNAKPLYLPTSTKWQDFVAWVNELPERESPEWLGLPPDSEKVLLIEEGKNMVRNVGRVMRALEEGDQVMAGEIVADVG